MPGSLLDRQTEPKPDFELLSFVQRQVRNARIHWDKERRAEERLPIVLPVTVQPVDDEFKPVGPHFSAVTRDISSKGIGLVCSNPNTCELLALRLSLGGEDVNVVMRISWLRQLGPFYCLGGDVIAKLNSDSQGPSTWSREL